MPSESFDLSNLKKQRPDLFDPSLQDDNAEVRKESPVSVEEKNSKKPVEQEPIEKGLEQTSWPSENK